MCVARWYVYSHCLPFFCRRFVRLKKQEEDNRKRKRTNKSSRDEQCSESEEADDEEYIPEEEEDQEVEETPIKKPKKTKKSKKTKRVSSGSNSSSTPPTATTNPQHSSSSASSASNSPVATVRFDAGTLGMPTPDVTTTYVRSLAFTILHPLFILHSQSLFNLLLLCESSLVGRLDWSSPMWKMQRHQKPQIIIPNRRRITKKVIHPL